MAYSISKSNCQIIMYVCDTERKYVHIHNYIHFHGKIKGQTVLQYIYGAAISLTGNTTLGVT